MQLTINYTGLHQFTINFHDQNAVKDCSKPGYPQPKKNPKNRKGALYGQSVLIDGDVTNQGENSQFSEFCALFFCFIGLRGHSGYRVGSCAQQQLAATRRALYCSRSTLA